MSLPKDPFMLYSAVNMLLRDRYSDLDDLCRSENVDRDSLIQTLRQAGFEYDTDTRQFG